MPAESLARYTWASYLRAVLAVARKDWLHFLRYPLNAVFRIVEPIMWLTPIYFLGRSFATAQGNIGFKEYVGVGDYMSFILLGGVLSSFIGAVFWGMGQSLKQEMDSGVLESNWMAPVPRPLLLIGQTVASITITSVTTAGTLFLAWLVFGFHVSGNVLYALSAALPMIVALYGFGFAFAAVVLLMRDANTLIDVSNYLVSIFSGSNFPVQVLPRPLLVISLALPLTYGMDAVRGFLMHTRTLIPLGYELLILLAFMALMVPLGYAVFRRVETRCRRLGTIGMH